MDAASQPTGSGKPELDMDAINAAVNATAGVDASVQGTFDVNDISLDDTPTTAAELEQQMKQNPEMSLAGTVIDKTVSTEDAVKAPTVKLSADVATTTPQDPSIITDSAEATPAEATTEAPAEAPAEAAPSAPEIAAQPEAAKAEASFVGGDLQNDEESAEAPAEGAPDDTTINYSDPVDNFEKDDGGEAIPDTPTVEELKAESEAEKAEEAKVDEAPAATPEAKKDEKEDKKKGKKGKEDKNAPQMPSNGMLPKEKISPFAEGGLFRSNGFIGVAVVLGVLVILGIVIAVALFS